MQSTKSLERYCAIVNGKEKARFLIAKESGLLQRKIAECKKILESCQLCERKCKVNREQGAVGFCKAGLDWSIFGAHSHFGEEAELVPSATLFAAGCTMRCSYCQNAPESMNPALGEQWGNEQVAKWIELEKEEGCRNVNFVGGEPTPYIYNVLQSLQLCNTNMPVVWNSNAYYSKECAALLRGIVDVYLLDFRYFNNECAKRLSNAPRYVEAAKRNFLDAWQDAELLVRLLVMPSHIDCCALPILQWLREQLGKDVRLNILQQYRPTWKAFDFPEIARGLTVGEYVDVVKYAKEIGLRNLV